MLFSSYFLLQFKKKREFDAHRALLTGVVRWLTLQGHNLVFLLIGLHCEVRQVLFHLPGHLSVFVQLLSVQEGAAAHSLLVGPALHVQDVGVGAALTQRPDRRGNSRK